MCPCQGGVLRVAICLVWLRHTAVLRCVIRGGWGGHEICICVLGEGEISIHVQGIDFI